MKLNKRFNFALLRRRVSKTVFLRLLLVLTFSVTVAGITLLPTVARRLRGGKPAAPASAANVERPSEGAKKAVRDSTPTLRDLFALPPVKVASKKGLSTIAASTDGASQDDDADLPEGKRV